MECLLLAAVGSRELNTQLACQLSRDGLAELVQGPLTLLAHVPPGLQYKHDVYISHKQSDAKDFARALHSLLSSRGFSTYLNPE